MILVLGFGFCVCLVNDPSKYLFTILSPPTSRSFVRSDSSMQESIYIDRFIFHRRVFRLQAFCYYNASLRFGVLLNPNVTDISEKLFPCTAKNA